MATIKLTLDTRRAKSNGEFPIRFCVHNYKTFYITSDVSTKIDCFENNIISKKDFLAKSKNAYLNEMLSRINELFFFNLRNNLILSDDQLKAEIAKCLGHKSLSIKLFYEYINELADKQLATSTQKGYLVVANLVKTFSPNAFPCDITWDWLEKLKNYLIQKGIKQNSQNLYFSKISATYNYLIRLGITDRNSYPFYDFKLKMQQTIKRSLTDEQLKAIRDFKCSNKKLMFFRDLFMLSFYLIGANTVDICHATKLENNRFVYYRHKTNRLYNIPFCDEAREILKRHKGKKFLFDFIEVTKYANINSYACLALRKLTYANGEPILDSLTMYYARHTWATIAARLDIPKETIAKCLGHADNSVTDVYINFDERKIDEAHQKVLDYVKNL